MAAVASLAAHPAWAKHDIEFVAEHLPEVAMDNRYATLPLDPGGSASPGYQLQAAEARTASGELEISGPMLSFGMHWRIGARTRLGALVFYDDLRLHSNPEIRPLQTLFAPQNPLDRPVTAQFSNLHGRALDYGGGLFWSRQQSEGFLGNHQWLAGLLLQRVELQDYRLDYRILEGSQSGTQGQIDFDTHYDHVVPFAALALPRELGSWTLTPHAQLAYPLPRRGIQGHITGPAFDIRGNTEAAGNGKHFGDPSLTLGLTLTYRPARLSVDIGTLVSQAFLESRIHEGIDRNLLLSFSWTH